MLHYITPNDVGVMALTDSDSINRAVARAKETGLNRVLIPRRNERTGLCRWDIDRAIMLCSDMEIILDNAYLRQADGCIDNVFINHVHDHPATTLDGEQRNIIIRGIGNAVIDGGEPNGLIEKTSLKDGRPHISRNNPILLHNIRGFVIENLTILNPRWWAINLLYAEQGRVSNIRICAENNIPNQDGIDLRIGCHDIIVENIFGYAGDDLIALSGFWGGRESNTCAVEGKCRDIHDITIRHVIATSDECAVIALRNTDGVKLYNVSIDDVHDSLIGAENSDPALGNYLLHFSNRRIVAAKSPYALLRIGQPAYFRERLNTPEDTFNINVSNIYARCNAAVMINVALGKSHFSGIYGSRETDRLITTRTDHYTQSYGADIRDTVFENCFFEADNRPGTIAFDFPVNQNMRKLENVIIRSAFLSGVETAVNMEQEGTLRIHDLFGCTNDQISHGDNAHVILDGKELD